MRRLILVVALFIAFASSVRAQTIEGQFNVSTLGLSTIGSLLPVELDGATGSEYLLKAGPNPFESTWAVIYPQTANGWCNAGTVTLYLASSGGTDTIADTDGDGKAQILRFDPVTQIATWLAFPTCGD